MDTPSFECEGLSVKHDGPLLSAHFARPDGNMISMEICRALTRLLLDPPGGTHILVLSSAGPQFCMGRERGSSDPAGLVAESEVLIALNEAIEASRLVTIAKVHGDAAGFGVGLAALCDVSIAVRSARFSFPEAKIGLAPALVLSWLPRVVGRQTAFWLTATSEELTGDDLLRFDLVTKLVSDRADLDSAVAEAVVSLSAIKPRVHADIKTILRDFEGVPSQKANRMASVSLVLGSMRRNE